MNSEGNANAVAGEGIVTATGEMTVPATSEVTVATAGDNTIFDDVFRTMLEKMPRLVIPVINEVFHTAYSDDEHIIQYRNEHYIGTDKIISDSFLGIEDKLYHIECQSNPDNTIEVRMIKYDFVIAVDNAKKHKDDEIYDIDFPCSCVLYLRHTEKTPDTVQVRINLPDGQSFIYSTPIVKVQKYTSEEIFEHKLFMFLPFYIMKYEKQLLEIGRDSDKLNALLNEYEKICQELTKALTGKEKSEYYNNMIVLIKRISDYMLRKEADVRKGIGDIMGGKVLDLPSDYIKQGRAEGKIEGKTEGMISLYKKKVITAEQAAEELGITVEKFLEVSA